MNVLPALTPVIQMLCVQTLMEVLPVPVTLVSLVMVHLVVSSYLSLVFVVIFIINHLCSM